MRLAGRLSARRGRAPVARAAGGAGGAYPCGRCLAGGVSPRHARRESAPADQRGHSRDPPPHESGADRRGPAAVRLPGALHAPTGTPHAPPPAGRAAGGAGARRRHPPRRADPGAVSVSIHARPGPRLYRDRRRPRAGGADEPAAPGGCRQRQDRRRGLLPARRRGHAGAGDRGVGTPAGRWPPRASPGRPHGADGAARAAAPCDAHAAARRQRCRGRTARRWADIAAAGADSRADRRRPRRHRRRHAGARGRGGPLSPPRPRRHRRAAPFRRAPAGDPPARAGRPAHPRHDRHPDPPHGRPCRLRRPRCLGARRGAAGSPAGGDLPCRPGGARPLVGLLRPQGGHRPPRLRRRTGRRGVEAGSREHRLGVRKSRQRAARGVPSRTSPRAAPTEAEGGRHGGLPGRPARRARRDERDRGGDRRARGDDHDDPRRRAVRARAAPSAPRSRRPRCGAWHLRRGDGRDRRAASPDRRVRGDDRRVRPGGAGFPAPRPGRPRGHAAERGAAALSRRPCARRRDGRRGPPRRARGLRP